MSSRKQGTAPPRRPRVPDWDPSAPALDRQTYTPKAGWLEILAGDNGDLRNPRDGKPMVTVIGTAAGLDRTRLTRIANGQCGLTTEVMASLAHFLVAYRGYTEAEARDALFQRVTAEPVAV